MKKILGIGNSLVDIMTKLENDDFLNDLQIKKGSMHLVDSDTSSKILEKTHHLKKELSSGGSAANTIHGLANLGLEVCFVGKVGKDAYGRFFSDDMVANNIKPILFEGNSDTGRAIAMISPDSERTFATYLGAAVELSAEDISNDLFLHYDYLYIEGYLIQNKELVLSAVNMAKNNNMKVFLDLASYNVVEHNLDFLKQLISEYVDVVFANEEEAFAFTSSAPEEAIKQLSCLCDISVVKMGKNGSLVMQNNKIYKINALQAHCIDTTGAGDAYAAGFIYGLAHDMPLDKCGAIGSLIAANVIEVIGAKLNKERWNEIIEKIKNLN